MKDRERATNEETLELKRYMEKLWQRLPGYARRAAALPSESAGSVEWLGRIGKFWWNAREGFGLDRNQMAERLGVDLDVVRFFELGLGEGKELTDLPQHYATVFGKPELYDEFCHKFRILKRPKIY